MTKKRILITGKDSYIGDSFANWLNRSEGEYEIHSIDMRGDAWKQHDFSYYDVVFHVAGIAHVSADPKLKELYYDVNTKLAIETAKVSKESGVNQFIFMSSMIVYGDSVKGQTAITRETKPNPSNFYGDSKLQAEIGINDLADDSFKIVIVRPPMIYGKDSKGNYPKLAKFAKTMPIFPDFNNQRSMLHIDNLAEFLKQVIDHNESGTFFPQNEEYVCTSQMVKEISSVHGKNIHLTKIFNPLLKLLYSTSLINKVFGDLVYEKELSSAGFEYRICNFQDSIVRTEESN